MKDEKIRIIPLGGVEEVGKNCTVFEYLPSNKQDKEIIVVDMGFDFPGPDLPGIDYILPDINYLKKNKDKIKGIVITHGHLDHVGAIPYFLKDLGSPVFYGTPLTLGIIKERLQEEKIKEKEVNLKTMLPGEEFSLGSFKISPFQVVHNIPDSTGLIINTPLGNIVHTGDFKIDEQPVDQKPLSKKKLKEVGRKGVLALLSDSTNATLPGHSTPEKEVGKIIDKIVQQAPQRIIFTTFSTLISRIQQVIYACHKNQRKIVLIGMSMKKSISLAQDLGYLKTFPGIFIELKDISDYADKKLLFLAAGAQGGEGSSMDKISDNKHWGLKVKKGDTVVFSSSTIPGNELAIHKTMDGLVNQGAKIIYRSVLGSGVHSSGHAFQDELKEMINIFQPKFFIPVEGQHYMQASHIDLAQERGVAKENCFMLYNGQILEINAQLQARVLKNKIPCKIIAVEGGKVNILDEQNLKIRRQIIESGICFLTALKNKKEIKIEIFFQGITIKEELLIKVKQKAKNLINKYNGSSKKKFINKMQNSLSDFILSKTGKKPLVIIVVN